MTFLKKRSSGFALIVVIWGLGMITLLVLSFLANGRQRLLLAFNVANSSKASYIAEGITNSASFRLLKQQSEGINNAQSLDATTYNGEPNFCILNGIAAAISIERENGKVDLNAATPELLEAFLRGFGLEPEVAKTITNNIVQYRTLVTDGAEPSLIKTTKPFQPKRGSFDTIMELDQVEGVNSELFRMLTPFITIYSRAIGIDIQTAPPALLAALSGASLNQVMTLAAQPYPNQFNRKNISLPNEFKLPGDSFSFSLHVEILMPNGIMASRETVIDFEGPNSNKFLIKEIRRGRSLYTDKLKELAAQNFGNAPNC